MPNSIQNCINSFAKLPTVGRKSAERFVLYLLKQSQVDLDEFADAVKNLKSGIKKCGVCGLLNENDTCSICADQKREREKICVVATTRDLIIIEDTGAYNGLYHVLGGVIDSIKGVAPEHLNIKSLIQHIQKNNIQEIILALNPNFEGEATALYLHNILKEYNKIKVTRLARGLPTGAAIEYADETTISNALKDRK
ncbi:MAG: recombination mediator RecR [Patescibacteria group bacterium]